MIRTMAEHDSHALIVGCGYLGTRVARRLLETGATVYATTRHERRLPELAELGVRPMLVSVTQPLTFAALRPALEAEALDVVYLVPPGRPDSDPSPRKVVLGGVAHLVKQLRHARVRRAVLMSSTAVYAQRDGERVDADSPAEPVDERGQLLHAGEQLWLAAGETYHVLRLAGLYGPGRVVGLSAVNSGAPLIGNPNALLNLIHADDAAELIVTMLHAADPPGRIELGCDGHPVPRLDYYTHLAQMIGQPPPRVLDDEDAARQFGLNLDRLRRSSSKALDNIPTCRRTGWSPRYANFRDGVAAAIEASR